ncbi:MAG: EF-hand domain-containing protein [Chloroflexota bacterium]
MISDIKRAKFTHYFHVTDLTGDGVITKADYLQAADKVIATLGLDTASQFAQMLKAGYEQYWNAITVADKDGNNEVSLEEWIDHFYNLGLNKEMVEAIVIARGNMVIQIFDTDRDGKVSKDEWATFFKAVGYPESEYEIAFSKLDTDGSGYLSQEELNVAGREFFSSDDPDARGNWIFGDYTKYLND